MVRSKGDPGVLSKLGELSVVAAHEIRNRLGSMMHAAQLLERRLPRDSEEHGLLRMLVSSADQLEGFVKDLLAYGRTQQPEKKIVSLGELLDAVSAQASEDPLFEGIEIGRDGPDVAVRCDAGTLRSVLSNLLRNAAEALRGAGSIAISTMRLPPPQGCAVVVRDTGPGMPPHVREHAFDLFFTTRPGGTGVGLALAHRILELHDWEVSLRCPARGGTEVVIEIPESDVFAEPPRVSAHPAAKGERTGNNILVVDDDVTTRRLIAEFLTDEGFRARGAASSQEAVQLCREFEPDVLLSDWYFKDGKNGIFVARELLRNYPDMAVVFQTGLEARELEGQLGGEQLPVHRILTKPISLMTLPGILRDAQGKRGPPSAGSVGQLRA